MRAAVFAWGATSVLAGCSIEPGAAGKPTYEADVRPILMARCVRCHGSPVLGDLGAGAPVPTVRFDVFGDTNCDGDAGAGCVHGAAFEAMAGKFATFLKLDQKMGGMPPLPAPKLTSYQQDTILNWAAESPPLEN